MVWTVATLNGMQEIFEGGQKDGHMKCMHVQAIIDMVSVQGSAQQEL